MADNGVHTNSQPMHEKIHHNQLEKYNAGHHEAGLIVKNYLHSRGRGTKSYTLEE